MRKHGRVDSTQGRIVEVLRATGHSVQILSSVGGGCPDLLVGRNGHNFLIEAKTDKGKLTGEQAIWHNEWKGQKAIARSPEEALDAVNMNVKSQTEIKP